MQKVWVKSALLRITQTRLKFIEQSLNYLERIRITHEVDFQSTKNLFTTKKNGWQLVSVEIHLNSSRFTLIINFKALIKMSQKVFTYLAILLGLIAGISSVAGIFGAHLDQFKNFHFPSSKKWLYLKVFGQVAGKSIRDASENFELEFVVSLVNQNTLSCSH